MQAPKTDILHSKNVRAAKRTEDIAHLSPGKHPSPIRRFHVLQVSVSSHHKPLMHVNNFSQQRLGHWRSSHQEAIFQCEALRETETPRKPFAQIMPPPSSVPSTPARSVTNDTEDENRTPNPKTFGAALNLKTPMTVAAPMQLAMTPAVASKVTAAPVSLVYEKPEPTLPEAIEYSFEERRLAIYLSRQVV